MHAQRKQRWCTLLVSKSIPAEEPSAVELLVLALVSSSRMDGERPNVRRLASADTAIAALPPPLLRPMVVSSGPNTSSVPMLHVSSWSLSASSSSSSSPSAPGSYLMKMLPGLMSRWARCLACRQRSPSATCFITRSTSSSVKACTATHRQLQVNKNNNIKRLTIKLLVPRSTRHTL